MDCTNCGAAIPPKEWETAGTCYNCGASIGFRPFVSGATVAMDQLERRVRDIREASGFGEDPRLEENRRSLAEMHESFAPVLPIFSDSEDIAASAGRHPTSQPVPEPVGSTDHRYYRVVGNIGGKMTAFWVEASTDGVARRIYCEYVTKSGWHLFNGNLGDSWPKEPKHRHPAQRESLEVSAASRDEPSEYLYRDPVERKIVLGQRPRM